MKYMLVFYYQNSRQNHNIKTANNLQKAWKSVSNIW